MVGALPSVAIVDDDDSFLRGLCRLLSAAGFDAHPFHSGREFLDSPSSGSVGCALLDIRMPGLDGFTLAQRLTDRGDHVPVIFMSAHDNDSNRRRAAKHGAAFLGKPATEKKILAAVRHALDPSDNQTGNEGDETKVP